MNHRLRVSSFQFQTSFLLILSEHFPLSIDCPPPRSVNQGPEPTKQQKTATDATTNDVVIVACHADTIPELALRFSNRKYHIQQLQYTNDDGDNDRNARKHDLEEQDGDSILPEPGRRVQRHHERSIKRVEQAHSRREQDRKDENEPDTRALTGADGRDTQQRDLGTGVEAETKQHAERIHLPGTIDETEQLLEKLEEHALTLDLELFLLRVCSSVPFFRSSRSGRRSRTITPPPQRHEQFPQNINIHTAQDDQETRTDRRPDDTSDPAETAKLAHRGRAAGDDKRRDDDNRAVAQTEERADGDGSLPAGHQSSRHEVDGGNVVGVESVAEAEGPGEDGGRDQRGVVA